MDDNEEQLSAEKILSRLEQELSVDTASAEYYITMPFDERLDLLLSTESPTVFIETGGVSTHLDNHDLFPPNTVEPVTIFVDENIPSEVELEAFSFHLSGSLSVDHKKIKLKAEVVSDLHDSVPTFIQNVPGVDNEFVVLRSTNNGFISETLNTEGLLYLLGSFADIDKAGITHALKEIEYNGKIRPNDLQILLMNTWSLIGFKMGSKKEVKTLSHNLPKESDMYSESIKLEYQEIENQAEDLLHFTLEQTKTFEGLDIEDTHSLTLEFSSDPKKAQYAILNQVAKRMVASGITPLSLVNITGSRTSGGRETQLNLNDPRVVTQFVDWFDQLVSS